MPPMKELLPTRADRKPVQRKSRAKEIGPAKRRQCESCGRMFVSRDDRHVTCCR